MGSSYSPEAEGSRVGRSNRRAIRPNERLNLAESDSEDEESDFEECMVENLFMDDDVEISHMRSR